MSEETRILFLTTFFIAPLLADSQYECGPHGRFEYCIEGIPGCVIGCHCHPGYYFDTDSKICESNIKLTQDFRRQYLPEPTRVHVASFTSPTEEQPVTSNAVDEKIDEIAKDADDLGDWLYNQFFKTIENQVINKTQGEELPPTRRSGNILLNKPSRRSHKYWRGRKKKKRKSKGLKSKLLRITEDDSLFDSESGSTSHDDDSSSSSDSETVSDDKGDNKRDDPHDHKKIIIFNKKPQPPLPSFIFLPNMDTPYYSPIGLPPPPAMPMYPMVPVPPMMPGPPMGGPLFPYPGVPSACEEATSQDSTDVTTVSATTETATAASTSITTEEHVTIESPSTKEQETPTTNETPITEESVPLETTTAEELAPALRLRQKKRKKPIERENYEKAAPNNPLMHGNRNKQLLKRLREKLNRKHKLESFFADQYQEPDTPIDANIPPEFIPKRDFMKPEENDMSPTVDVDFKYLAELIHKADLNKTLNNRKNKKTTNQNVSIPANENGPFMPLPSRRNDYQTNNVNNMPVNNIIRQRSRMEDPNDSFYTNLGKQIASMIRKIDSKEEREVNIEVEGANSKQQTQTSPVFNENNFASRSYWERSVRSPIQYFSSFRKEMDHLRNSNEDLFSLENKVEIAASTPPTLSLNDLENIISTVEKVQLKKPKRMNQAHLVHPNASFKLNLLPENIQYTIPRTKSVQSFRNQDSGIIHDQNTRRQQSNSNSFLLSNFRQLSPDYDDPINSTGTGSNLLENLRPTRKPSINKKPNRRAPVTQRVSNMVPTYKATANKTNHQNYKYLSPVLLNHRTINYYPHSTNQYQFEKTPIQYTGIPKSLVPYGRVNKPSYFHHEFHHFDYFDT